MKIFEILFDDERCAGQLAPDDFFNKLLKTVLMSLYFTIIYFSFFTVWAEAEVVLLHPAPHGTYTASAAVPVVVLKGGGSIIDSILIQDHEIPRGQDSSLSCALHIANNEDHEAKIQDQDQEVPVGVGM